MTRCEHCNGIVKKTDSECYMCGERVPKYVSLVVESKQFSMLSNVVFLASLGYTAFCWISEQKLPLSASLAISGTLLLVKFLADRHAKRNSNRNV
jgi:hypothetical protein